MGLVALLKSFTRTTRKGSNITDVKCDPGGKPLATYEHFSAPGDDAFPLVDDYVAAVETKRTGRAVAVGYMDVINTPKATEGDKRIYGRDSAGTAVNEVWLKSDETITVNNSECDATFAPDGEVTISNSLGSYTLSPDGQTKITNALGSYTLDAAGQTTIINPLGSYTLLPTGQTTIINPLGLITLLPTGVINLNGVTIDNLGNVIVPPAASIITQSIRVDGKEIKDHDHPAGTPPGNTGTNN